MTLNNTVKQRKPLHAIECKDSGCIPKSRILALLGRETPSDWILFGELRGVSNHWPFHVLARPGSLALR